MKLLRMTATFGRLDHETLTLTDGLNLLFGDYRWRFKTDCLCVYESSCRHNSAAEKSFCNAPADFLLLEFNAYHKTYAADFRSFSADKHFLLFHSTSLRVSVRRKMI